MIDYCDKQSCNNRHYRTERNKNKYADNPSPRNVYFSIFLLGISKTKSFVDFVPHLFVCNIDAPKSSPYYCKDYANNNENNVRKQILFNVHSGNPNGY